VDLAKNTMTDRWPVTSASSNYPMALDEAHHRLLIGCRRPARMLVIDTETGKQTASVEIVGDTDDLFYDAASAVRPKFCLFCGAGNPARSRLSGGFFASCASLRGRRRRLKAGLQPRLAAPQPSAYSLLCLPQTTS
jgi:hypothetical protein